MTPIDAPGKQAFWKHCGFQKKKMMVNSIFPCFQKASFPGLYKVGIAW